MASEIGCGGLSDSLKYFISGNGSAETFEPFCETSLVEPYPHNSLQEARELLDIAGRVQLVDSSARCSTWIVDQAIRVKGWSEEVIRANSAIWSKRLMTANIFLVTSAVTTITASVYALFGTEMGTFLFKIIGDPMARRVAWAAFGTLGWNHIALLALIVGAAALWSLSSRRRELAQSQLGETGQTAADSVAAFRDRALRSDFYQAIAHRGAPGRVTANGFIAPKEAQWLWVERIRQESAAFENPVEITGAELTFAFTRRNPFDVMERALEGSPIASLLSSAQASYQPLASQLRQVQQGYDMRAQSIRDLAEKNRELIRERRRAAFAVVDSIYWNRVDAARIERDRSLQPYLPTSFSLSLEEAREAERRYNSDPCVIAIKTSYLLKTSRYDRNRALAHAAIRGWFNPQIQSEYEREEADLKANYQTNLQHLGGYFPAVRALYSWTARALENPLEDAEAIGMAPALSQLSSISAPVLPDMLTATPPAEPPSSEMRSWADAGSGLGLDFFLTCAAAGVGFYAAYKANSATYEQVIADHQNDASAAPPQYEEPVRPPPYAPGFYAPPSYEEATFSAAPSPPPAYLHQDPVRPPPYAPGFYAPPSYEEATGSLEPSAPPAELYSGR